MSPIKNYVIINFQTLKDMRKNVKNAIILSTCLLLNSCYIDYEFFEGVQEGLDYLLIFACIIIGISSIVVYIYYWIKDDDNCLSNKVLKYGIILLAVAILTLYVKFS